MHSDREWQERDGNQASFLLQKKTHPRHKSCQVLKMSTSPFDKSKQTEKRTIPGPLLNIPVRFGWEGKN